MNEPWKPISGYEELYEVSSLGRVRRICSITRGKAGNIKSPHISKRWGYKYVALYKDGKPKCCRVARLVALAFLPNPDHKEQVNHKNGIKADDNVDNLEWSTRSENQKHAVASGLRTAKGVKNSQAKLTNEDIVKIRSLLWSMKQKQIAALFGVHQTTIAKISSGKIWTHIK